jgi:hypothetical protein
LIGVGDPSCLEDIAAVGTIGHGIEAVIPGTPVVVAAGARTVVNLATIDRAIANRRPMAVIESLVAVAIGTLHAMGNVVVGESPWAGDVVSLRHDESTFRLVDPGGFHRPVRWAGNGV